MRGATSKPPGRNRRRPFQSTHLREVRRTSPKPSQPPNPCFNPHTYERCDSPRRRTCLGNWFQSTHLREMRLMRWSSTPWYFVSIHTPTRGATHSTADDHLRGQVSIHTPTRGATHQAARVFVTPCFNPHTYERCDAESIPR